MSDFLKKLIGLTFHTENDCMLDEKRPVPGSQESVLLGIKGMLMPITKAYRMQYRREGATPKGVFWANADNVGQRFKILSSVFDPEDIATGDATIADLGCGYGAFYDYLKAHPVIRGGEYRGYDICESLLDACKTRIKDPRASFHLNMRVTEPADYSFVSGTFNLKMDANEDDWLTYTQISLKALWEQTNKAMAFNMLDIADAAPMDGLYYADPRVFESFCRESMSGDVKVMTNYGLPDFTIFIRR